ncbi:MAG TPA: TRAP transporter substrate-binding protein DctP [Dehalococcoidales bacterium]|nr:TRAP transporter substrate-binding protein DctP [Dehalococcoidales bacterium]
MKKIPLVLFAILLVSSLLVVGCAQATPAQTAVPATVTVTVTAPAPVASPTPTAPAKTIELSFSHTFPPGSSLGMTLQRWADRIGEETNGRVKITVYGGGSLLKAAEIYDGVATGVADIGYGHPSDDLGRFGLESAFALPGLGWPEAWPIVVSKNRIAREIRGKFPQIQAKQADVVHLADGWMPPYTFQSVKKAVRVPEDIKGMRVAASGFLIPMAETLGAVPVTVPAADRYMSLERGLIDGSWDIWGGIFAMRHFEISKFFTDGPDFGEASAMIIMNKKKYDALPEDIKQIFQFQRNFSLLLHREAYIPAIQLGQNNAVQKGAQLIATTPEENARWVKALQPVEAAWIKDIEARGLPAKAFLDELKRMIEQAKVKK